MLPQAFLDIPRLGTLNIHPSLLPQYADGSTHIFTHLMQRLDGLPGLTGLWHRRTWGLPEDMVQHKLQILDILTRQGSDSNFGSLAKQHSSSNPRPPTALNSAIPAAFPPGHRQHAGPPCRHVGPP
eukprot:364982-Chlamydomonas_euryale.AAC.9